MKARFAVLISVLNVALAAPSRDVHFDAAPYATTLPVDNGTELQWSDIRRVSQVLIAFANDGKQLPATSAVKVEYWRQSWKGDAVGRYGGRDAGSHGWDATDDWYNGKWTTADATASVSGRTMSFRFAPSSDKEFPELKVRGVTYRPTLKLRVVFSGEHPQMKSLSALTDSLWQEPVNLRIRFAGRTSCDDPLEVYNGSVGERRAASENGECVLHASIRWAANAEDPEADRTVVTVRSASHPFSFAVDEAARGDRIYVKDFGAMVTQEQDPVGTIAEYDRVLAASGAKSIYDRVGDHAEQTLKNAWDDMPLKRPYPFVLGLEGTRQRFKLQPDGALWMNHPNYAGKHPGTEGGHLQWPDPVTYRFGLPEGRFADRTIAEGYLPIVTTRWIEGGLVYEEEAFATVMNGELNPSKALAGDEPTVAMIRIRIVNTADEQQTARLRFSTGQQPRNSQEVQPFEKLKIQDDRVIGEFQGKEAVRLLVDTGGGGKKVETPQGIEWMMNVAPHKTHEVYVRAPFLTPSGDAEVAHLRSLDYRKEREIVAAFWKARVAAGSSIHTPEPWLNEFYKAVLTHLLINDEREPGSDRYAARVGGFYYGAYGNESIMMISDLDRRGYTKEAERSLELFLHYQGSVALPGTFTSQGGELYGAGGYEAGGYNQHHGWILWGLGEHWWYTRDREWMQRSAPKIVAACRWIATQRKLTQKQDAQGRRVPEYGLLPAGSLEDVTDYWPWLSTNAFSWWGMANAAAALKDFGDPSGPALIEEAEAYRNDILRDFTESAVRSPVVEIRNGTYVQDVPSNPYIRGRAHGWLRETLEGAIMLPITRLMDPSSTLAKHILEDYEGNRYISDRFGYSIPVFDRFWFSRGGFSMQPNLLHGPLPYLYRDEIERYVRAYFNPFAAGYDPGTRELPEHPLPELGMFFGDWYKSSDESQSTYWLRLMFVAEIDNALHLGRALPRYWLRDGETLSIRNAATHFGPVSYEIKSNAGQGRITMTLEPPSRNSPKAIVVRFRHPEDKPMARVTVNGAGWTDFDAKKGDIRLPGDLKGETTVIAEY
jgi:hypothetical protein